MEQGLGRAGLQQLHGKHQAQEGGHRPCLAVLASSSSRSRNAVQFAHLHAVFCALVCERVQKEQRNWCIAFNSGRPRVEQPRAGGRRRESRGNRLHIEVPPCARGLGTCGCVQAGARGLAASVDDRRRWAMHALPRRQGLRLAHSYIPRAVSQPHHLRGSTGRACGLGPQGWRRAVVDVKISARSPRRVAVQR